MPNPSDAQCTKQTGTMDNFLLQDSFDSSFLFSVSTATISSKTHMHWWGCRYVPQSCIIKSLLYSINNTLSSRNLTSSVGKGTLSSPRSQDHFCCYLRVHHWIKIKNKNGFLFSDRAICGSIKQNAVKLCFG